MLDLQKKTKKKKNNKSLKIAVLSILTIITAIIISAFVSFSYFSSKINKVDIDRSYVTDTGKEPAKEDKHVITVALLGSDFTGDTVGASDSTMILSIDTKNNNMKLCSLMRDMYLDLPDGGKQNLNYTMVSGGPELLLRTINYNFNLQVDKFVHVSLRTLPKLIDILGGVELNITDEELIYINGIIPSIDQENGTSTPLLSYSGMQKLNGTQASAYARIRSTSGRDYKRSERQRYILTSLFDNVKNTSVTELPNLINQILPFISTNLSSTEILSIATNVLSLGISDFQQARFPLDEHHTMELTDMYHMIIDADATTKAIHSFIYSLDQ